MLAFITRSLVGVFPPPSFPVFIPPDVRATVGRSTVGSVTTNDRVNLRWWGCGGATSHILTHVAHSSSRV